MSSKESPSSAPMGTWKCAVHRHLLSNEFSRTPCGFEILFPPGSVGVKAIK